MDHVVKISCRKISPVLVQISLSMELTYSENTAISVFLKTYLQFKDLYYTRLLLK